MTTRDRRVTPRGQGRRHLEGSKVAGAPRSGVVVSHLGVAVEVEFEEPRETRLVRVQRRSGHVVGDRVTVTGDRLVRLPRSRELRRRSPGGGVHVVAAHLDLVVVVVALEPPPRIGLIDRAAVAARSAGLDVALCVNKLDLEGGPELLELLEETVGAAMPVVGVSATTSDGCDELRTLIRAHGRAVLTGHSGVGKSTLVNQLVPGVALSTGALSDASGRGRHTTTVSTLHRLATGGELVDTPGIKEFGLVEITPSDLAHHFVGFENVEPGSCRFRDCLHQGEPGCAIERAVQAGEIEEERLESYRGLLHEVQTGADPRA